MVYIDLVVEDVLQEAAARRVIQASTAEVQIQRVFGRRGFAFIDRNIGRYAMAARHSCFLIVRDLDRVECAPVLARELLPEGPSPGLVLCIAVREVEAWLLADAESLEQYLGVTRSGVGNPESIDDPKRFIVECARRSRRREIRRSLVPEGVARVGPLYNASMLRFINDHWRIQEAARRSPSLLRFVQKVDLLA